MTIYRDTRSDQAVLSVIPPSKPVKDKFIDHMHDHAILPELPDLHFERLLWEQGIPNICGIDEAGRGAWAGPVAAGAVILPPDPEIESTLNGVRDSKQMTAIQRARWAEAIKETALSWNVAFASSDEIDSIGIVPATRLAITRAIDKLNPSPEHLIIDYLTLSECPLPQTALSKGDRRSLSVAAASVLAKTARDELMRELDSEYPAYGFYRHKGYGTIQHRRVIKQDGLCAIHRKSFAINI